MSFNDQLKANGSSADSRTIPIALFDETNSTITSLVLSS